MNINIPYRNLLLALVLFVFPETLFSQYQQFLNSYDLLTTIAGKGEMDDGQIGWLPEYENGNAVDAELTRPHFAMADTAGNIYIADKDAHGIRRVTKDGKIITIAGTNTAGDNGDGPGTSCMLNSPNGLWVSKDGIVYILDLGNNKIRRLDKDGNLETIVHDEEGISLGRGLWLTATEDTIFYSSSSRIKMWTENTGIVTYSTGYSAVSNIMMDKQGYLVATDRSANLVYRISKDGTSREIIAGNGTYTGGGDGYPAIETGLAGVRGVWFLDDNTYILATHEGSQIWYVDHAGYIHLFLNGREGDEYHSGDGENFRTPGYKISEARSVSVDYDGNVLIVENDYGFVRKIDNSYTYYYTGIYSKMNTSRAIELYPNPASTETKIRYCLSEAGPVSLVLYDCLGKRIMTLHDDYRNTGTQSFTLNLSDIPEGVWFLSLTSGASCQVTKLLVSR